LLAAGVELTAGGVAPDNSKASPIAA